MKKLFLLTILLTSTICSNAQEFSVVILGDGYGSAKAQFTADASDVQKGMLDRPPFRQRRNQIVFYQGSYNNKFACKVISGNASLSHALDCSWSKIFKEAASVHPYSLVIVLVNKQGYGTGNTGIAVIGTGAHDNLTATNNLLGATYSERLQSTAAHEIGHAFGLPDTTDLNDIMGADGTCNGGACGVNKTYIPVHQDKINQLLDERCCLFVDFQAPYVQITSPISATEFNYQQPISVTATSYDSQGIMRSELYIDDQLTLTQVCWDRNPNCNDSGIRFYITSLSPGWHTINVKVIDAAYNSFTSQTTIKITQP